MIETDSFRVPVRIYTEVRASVRASLGKDYVILRLPVFAHSDLQKHLDFTKKWLEKVVKKSPAALDKYQMDKVDGDYSFKILGKYEYRVAVDFYPGDRGQIGLDDFVLRLKIPEALDEFSQRKMMRELISKMMAKVFKPLIVKKVDAINSQHFNKRVKGITLRYNSTNWGSCSTTGRINISTRALLLPEDVFEYIIVHELSHMVEMNHSAAFWRVVKKAMPDYEDKERYIRKNTVRLDF